MITIGRLILELLWQLRTPLILPLDIEYKRIPYYILYDINREITLDYKINLPDCDDFAWVYKWEAIKRGYNSVGFVIGWLEWELHCWNCAITDGGIFQIEPQNGYIFQNDKRYKVIGVII